MKAGEPQRDAAAHRLYHKKARNAQGWRLDKQDEWKQDTDDWCYVWQSDNTKKSATEKPTIQHGYARGVVGLFIQLVDSTVATVCEHQAWRSSASRMPKEWFRQTIPSGPCEGMTLWDGHELRR